MYDMYVEGFKWKLSFNRIIEGRAHCQVLKIISLVVNRSLNGEGDEINWQISSKKTYKVNSMYNFLSFSGRKLVGFVNIWKSQRSLKTVCGY